MRSRFSENRERKSDNCEGFKTNAVVSVFFFILSNKKGNAVGLKEMRRCLRNIYLFFFGLSEATLTKSLIQPYSN